MLAGDGTATLKSRLRYFRAFDFNTGPEKAKSLLGLLEKADAQDTAVKKLVLNHLDEGAVRNSSLAQRELKQLLQSMAATPGDEYIQLIRRYNVKTEMKPWEACYRKTDRLGSKRCRSFIQTECLALTWKTLMVLTRRLKDTAGAIDQLKHRIRRFITTAGIHKKYACTSTTRLRKNRNSGTGENRFWKY